MDKRARGDFHRRLGRWYGANGRKDLPWRNTPDAYAIYISEIMLQQTQVKTVLERYYVPFLKKFPTLQALAKAKRDEVLSAWQGLGYYNRAINLHEAAKRCGGALPDTAEGLMGLPGIGRNTAHAVAAFAFGGKVAVMEANVRRVLARIYALKTPGEIELWEKAQALLDTRNAFDYNQAMMDIGALVCTKRNPKCGECPAGGICLGKIAPQEYPAVKSKKKVPVRKKKIVVWRNGRGEYYAVARTTRFLRGLYHFGEMDCSAHTITAPHPGPPPRGGREYLGEVRQEYSHFTLEAEVFLAVKEGRGKDWYSLAALRALPMSMAEKKIITLLSNARLVESRHLKKADPSLPPTPRLRGTGRSG